MRSTGEVMGIDRDFPTAFAKSQEAAYGGMPLRGTVFISVADSDKRAVILPAHACRSSASTSWRPRAPPRCCAATASRRVVSKYSEAQGAAATRSWT